jgi:hypothetical protein
MIKIISIVNIFYAHNILGYFCILKRVCQVLLFLLPLPHTMVFQYLRPHIRLPLVLLYGGKERMGIDAHLTEECDIDQASALCPIAYF